MIYNKAGIPLKDVLILALLQKPAAGPWQDWAKRRLPHADEVADPDADAPAAPVRRRFSIDVGPLKPSPVLVDAPGYPRPILASGKPVVSRAGIPLQRMRGVDRHIAKSIQRGYTKHRNPTIPKALRPARDAARIAAEAAVKDSVTITDPATLAAAG